MFLDRVKIWIRAGDGGDGAATFRREAHVPRGGPDGGDGGRGGSIVLRVDPGLTTLLDFRYRHHFRAEPGGRGLGAKRHGKSGEDLLLPVPPGTGVLDEATGELLADLVATGQSATVARGGRGGLGNVHFATAMHRTPRHAQKGEPGEERWLRLELRLIADVGPTRTFTVTFLIPVFGTLWGALFLDEPVGMSTLAGGAVIVIATVLVLETGKAPAVSVAD